MKMNTVLGLMVSFAFVAPNLALAAGAKGEVTDSIRASIAKDRDALKAQALSGHPDVSKLDDSARSKANADVLHRADINNNDLKSALDGDKSGATLDMVLTLAAAKRVAKSMQSAGQPEGQIAEGKALQSAVETLIEFAGNKVMADADQIAAGQQLNPTQAAAAKSAYNRLTSNDFMTSILGMKAEKRTPYLAVLEKANTILKAGNKANGPQALVMAIVEVRGVTVDQAIEIVKKIVDCSL